MGSVAKRMVQRLCLESGATMLTVLAETVLIMFPYQVLCN